MKKIILLIISVLLVVACNYVEDDLDNIKEFNVENKYFKADMKSLHFIIETSAISEVDSMFSKFMQQNNIPEDAAGCADGIYTGESPLDAYDYGHIVKIEIEKEKIISVDYNEIKKNGLGKEEDVEYNEEMEPSGTTPSIAYPEMEKQLLQKQNVNLVDAVSGATYSLYRFRYALAIALMKARISNNKN